MISSRSLMFNLFSYCALHLIEVCIFFIETCFQVFFTFAHEHERDSFLLKIIYQSFFNLNKNYFVIILPLIPNPFDFLILTQNLIRLDKGSFLVITRHYLFVYNEVNTFGCFPRFAQFHFLNNVYSSIC